MNTTEIQYKNYVIMTTEGIQHGIFFRSPIQKVDYDAYYDNPRFSAWKYLNQIKNPFRKLYEILIGNYRIVKNIQEWSNDINWGGFRANILCSPIHFRREYRQLSAISTNAHDNIQCVDSYGYESEFNSCVGDCVCEKTSIKLKTGKWLKFKKTEQYYFTYEHIIKRIIDDGLNKEDVT